MIGDDLYKQERVSFAIDSKLKKKLERKAKKLRVSVSFLLREMIRDQLEDK